MILKFDFEVTVGNTDAKALEQVTHFLQKIKEKIVRKGNNLKTPKIHQVLHVIDYITIHGCPMNYDGSRGESFGTFKIKDNTSSLTKRNVH